ncbi:MAG TPA: Ig-like domain-containing protein [Candidatus Limnocylindrales bacterium]|nr:Ig-like domain-containing protein [Candidatus Limnocylindrales bacterium]
MRKYLVALLAVPVLVSVYSAAALGRSRVVRAGVAISLGAVMALGAITLARPAVTTASAVRDIVPLTQAAFSTTVGTKVQLNAPATISFTTPMERASVEAALTIEPRTDITFRWNDDDTSLVIAPATHWAAGTFYTISVGPGALASTGRPMTSPVRAAFLTRAATTATVAATSQSGSRVAIDSAFTVTFDQPVDPTSIAAAIRLEPATSGSLTSQVGPGGRTVYMFTPSRLLKADARYRLLIVGARDASGSQIAATSLAVRTSVAPAVVRFRPRPLTQDVPRDTAISVRFTRPMDHRTTKAAFRVTAGGKAVKGTISFAENGRVLVFDPASPLPWDSRVVAMVSRTARSTDGTSLSKTASVAFHTVARVIRVSAASTSAGSGGGGGGGTVGTATWGAVERYYLKLMNCTRTGGNVTSGGDCSSPGGRNVAPLKLDAGISSKVARPYAKKLAVNNMCTHFSGGNPGDRLRRAGYTSYRWAENLGCRSGNPYSAVLGSHLYFQSERSWSPDGGHYVNLMNSAYDRAGIGVWVSGGRVRLVVDFYHP